MRWKVIVFSMFVTLGLQAQNRFNYPIWVDFTPKASFGFSYMKNMNMMGDMDVDMKYLNPTYTFGFRTGVTFLEQINISVAYEFKKFTQNMGLQKAGKSHNIDYTKNIGFKNTDLSFLIKYIFRNGVYVEAGPKVSHIHSVELENIFSNVPDDVAKDIQFQDLDKSGYKEKYTSIAAGAGLIVLSTDNDRLRLNFGVRFNFGLTDMMATMTNPPVNDGVYTFNTHYTANYNKDSYTQMFTGEAVIELNYFFGYYATAGYAKKGFKLFK